ncbi:MAG: 3-hydroxy-9,10-secoandrosta,3,5(10)-triene-9,17-dione monooxygenase reductase component [Acidimicrobiaceae bacterium]|jgi:3-hydroxy-9,10-secoandrosta-1,3,5(10)-triene-9,17-dione monooxygenase reductase component
MSLGLSSSVVTADHQQQSAFDNAKFRQVLGHFPTGVVVVTAIHEGAPVGLAIGSFTSVSLDPPLIGFLPDKSSSSWPKIQAAGAFCVNILGDDQEDVCRIFATKSADKFATIGWKPGRTGAPIINDVSAYIECELGDVIETGDHYFVLGKVIDLEVNHQGGPLVFYRGGYGRYSI